MDLFDIRSKDLIEYLSNQKKVAADLGAPKAEIELLQDIISEVVRMSNKYYNTVTEC